MSSNGDQDLEDRISSLPDCVLTHILSLLPSVSSFGTSVLSKRWKHLPHQVPKIILDESSDKIFFDRREWQYFDMEESDERILQMPKLGIKGFYKSPKFVSFVSNRLLSCETCPIAEFRLKCEIRRNVLPGLNLWIRDLVCSSNIKVVEIFDEYLRPYVDGLIYPPSELFLMKNLAVLKLDSMHIVLHMPAVVSLPNLKLLRLINVVLRSESEDFRFADEGFPLLEDLWLGQVTFQTSTGNEGFLRFSLPSLRKLRIICEDKLIRCIHIDTPNLRHLVWAFSKLEVCLRKCEYLENADLWQSDTIFSPDEWYFKVMSKLSNVKALDLTSDPDSEVISTCGNLLPLFSNLTNLCLVSKFDMMWILLQKAPNLKVLEWEIIFKEIRFEQGDSLLEGFSQNLKEVRLRECDYLTQTEMEVEIVRFFLLNGGALEKMVIEHPRNSYDMMTDEQRLSILNTFLELERRSPECEIQLCRFIRW